MTAADAELASEAALHTEADGDGWRLALLVEGMHCGACVARIERSLAGLEGVRQARANLTERRLSLAWDGPRERAGALVRAVEELGYGAVPFDGAALAGREDPEAKQLLYAMAAAGFGAANVMLLSVAVWAGHAQGMGEATRSLLHWISALVALPVLVYAGRPFYRSAARALRSWSSSMDIPITVAIFLTAGMSLSETVLGGPHAYYDSVLALAFFLLLGRYLERRARGRARSAATRLLALRRQSVTVIGDGGATSLRLATSVLPGMRVMVAAGERIGVDGRVVEGRSEVDRSLVTGESRPAAVAPGDDVHAGCVNLGGALTLEATRGPEDTLLAEITRLIERAESRRSRYATLSDRLVRWYTPVVHLAAAAALAGWLASGAGIRESLLVAVAVLIITCPCALGLAVPTVQTVAVGRLYRSGILVKEPDALERLAAVDTVALDKTGTLTAGEPTLHGGGHNPEELRIASSIAAASRHPLARALRQAAPEVPVASNVAETPGAGLEAWTDGGRVRLGSRNWCGVDGPSGERPEIWMAREGAPPARFAFDDRLREDAAQIVGRLQQSCETALLSGDHQAAVDAAAAACGIKQAEAGLDPAQKAERLEAMRETGHKVAMVGDGLNDAVALSAAHCSLSPSTASDISRNCADIVYQGNRLEPVMTAIQVARRARRVAVQNLAMACAYNVIAVPVAMAGLVTPLVAAVAMSGSSILVTLNALRTAGGEEAP